MSVQPIPDGYHSVTPYLVVEGVDGLISFMQGAFCATERSRNLDSEGRVMHAEVQLGDSVVMMGAASDAFAAMPAMIHLYVPDVDATYKRAITAGAESLRAPEDQFYGDRSAGVKDKWSNQWWLATHVEDVSDEEMRRRAAATSS